jgi:hypothetical protein
VRLKIRIRQFWRRGQAGSRKKGENTDISANVVRKLGSGKRLDSINKNNYKNSDLCFRIVHNALRWGDSEAQPGPRRGLERCVASQGVTH